MSCSVNAALFFPLASGSQAGVYYNTFHSYYTGDAPSRLCKRNGNTVTIKIRDCSVLGELQNDSYTPINATHLQTTVDRLTHVILCNSTDANSPKPVICLRAMLQDPMQQLSLFVLQVIGITVDIVSCVIYIGTFLFFSDIRTLFGKLVINLIVVILFGDMFYLMSLKAPEEDPSTEQYCEAVAIVTHFLFLARFSWMTVLSTYIAKTFYAAWQMQQPIKDKKKNRIRLFLGMAVGYGVPGALVVLCICVNYTVKNSIRYGRTPVGNCWITHDKALYLAYVAPIAISILINLLLSIFSIAVLKMIRNNAAKKAKEFWRLFQDCRVVFGILSVMGITWFFGFLGLIGDVKAIDGLSWTWYPFVILSTCQAATLALAFLAKKDVFDFYSAKYAEMLSTIRRSFRSGTSSRSTSISSARTSQSAEQRNKPDNRAPSNVEKGSSSQSNGNLEDSMKQRGSTSTEGLQSPSATSTQAMVVELEE